jgi:signal peptidase I
VIALLIIIVVLVGGLIFMKAQDKPNKWKSFRDSTWWEYIQVFAVAFVLVFGFMRPFVVEAFKIPSASMENTLLIGDRILVAKFMYGVKVPFTDIRILDFHEPEVGDIFVFKPPPKAGRTQNFIKRIIGLPGDVMEIRDGKLHRNGEPVEGENYVKRLLFPIDLSYEKELDDKTISRSLQRAFRNGRSALSSNAVVSIQEKGSRWKIEDSDKGRTYLVRKDVLRNRYTKAYRMNVYISDEAYFQRPASARRRPRDTILDKRGPYKVPEGYVFAMGDNRDQSNDSRAWGPVPIEDIKGQAFLIYWSWNPEGDWLHKIRFPRIGRVVK